MKYKTNDYPTFKRNFCSLDDQSKSLPYVVYIIYTHIFVTEKGGLCVTEPSIEQS